MRLPAENIKAAREVQLVDFLNTYRPGELVRKSRDEYCTKSHSSLRITPSKNLFHWCSQSKGGRGALDYLLTVEGMSFRSAVMLLNEMELVPFQQVRVATVESSRTHDFTLPRPDKNAQAATAYLMHRGTRSQRPPAHATDRLVPSPRRRLPMRPPTVPATPPLRNCRVRPRTLSTTL